MNTKGMIRMNIRGGLLTGMLLFASAGMAQDTISRYTAIAGPDIQVCTGGSVMLNGEMGGEATQATWRGGKGVFIPGRNFLQAEYTPAAEEAGKTVVLILVTSDSVKKGLPGRDEIKISVNEEPKANAGPDLRICAGEPVLLHGTVEKKFKSVEWKTNGSGSFDKAGNLETVYTPSQKDIEGGGLSLEFTAFAEGVCQSSMDAMIVMIDPSPDFTVEADVTVEAGKPAWLSLQYRTAPGSVTWKTIGTGSFSSPGKPETFYTPTPEDILRETLPVEVTVGMPAGGCKRTKTINLHFKTRNSGKTN